MQQCLQHEVVCFHQCTVTGLRGEKREKEGGRGKKEGGIKEGCSWCTCMYSCVDVHYNYNPCTCSGGLF